MFRKLNGLGRLSKIWLNCVLCLFLYTSVLAQSIQPVDTSQAYKLFEQGLDFQKQAEYEKSVETLKEATAGYLSAGQWARAAGCYNEISYNYRVLGQPQKAEHYANRVLKLSKEKGQEMHSERAKAFNNLGMIKTGQNELALALAYLESGLEEAGKSETPLSLKSMLLANIGSVYDDKGKYDEALGYYENALKLLEHIHSRQEEQLANLYNYMGITYRKKGQYDEALKFYEKELEINTKLYGKSHPSVARIYNNMGGVYYTKGDIGEAITYFENAASATQQVLGEAHPRVGLLYNNIGAVYYRTGNNSKAVEYLIKSAEIKKETQGAEHPGLALTYNNIGSIYTEMEKYEQAVDYLNRSLAIRTKQLGGDHPVLTHNHNALGVLYLDLEEFQKAIDHFKKGLTITKKSRGNDHPYVVESLVNLARAHTRKGNYSQALTYLNEAEGLLSVNSEEAFNSGVSYQYPVNAVEVLFQKGKTLQQQYEKHNGYVQLKLARSAYMKLSGLLDDIQRGFQSEQSKLIMSSKSHLIYEKAIQVSHLLYKETESKQYLEDIYFYSEKSKSRVILELLNARRAQSFAGIPDSLISYEHQLRQKISAGHQRLMDAMDLSEENKHTPALRDSLFARERVLDKHLEYLERNYPKYHAFKFNTRIPTAAETRKVLSEKGLTLVEYFWGEESSWAVVMNRQELHVEPLPYNPGLPQEVFDFKKAITEKQNDAYLDLGYRLYKTLIQPVKNKLGSGPVLIVGDGVLSQLPFEALLTRQADKNTPFSELPYLLNSFSVSYTPSISLSSFFEEREERSYTDKLVAFAPVFSFSNPLGLQVKPERNSWSALPSTKYEVNQIAENINNDRSFWATLTGNKPSAVFTNKAATESRFKSESLGRYRYVHLATHAFTSESAGGLAGIVFHPEEDGREDGVLYAEEIYGLRLQNDLVVLSACETGTGNIRAGEGIIGFSRAFQYAGAKNLLVSLWNLEDRSTARLMISFYEQIENGKTYFNALREAKKILLSSSAYTHPRYWAPFVFIGN